MNRRPIFCPAYANLIEAGDLIQLRGAWDEVCAVLPAPEWLPPGGPVVITLASRPGYATVLLPGHLFTIAR